MWYRVFGLTDTAVSPAALAGHLHAAGFAVVPRFRGDDLGWTAGELDLPGGTTLTLDRYLTAEDDLRDDLNAHAAELEALDAPKSGDLMRHVIQTKQLIVFQQPGDDAAAVCESAARFLAAGTDGVYQADGRGWFAADGTPLVREA